MDALRDALRRRQGRGGEREDSVGVLAGESVREYLANLVAVLASGGAFAQVSLARAHVRCRQRVRGGRGAASSSRACVRACVRACGRTSERASEREGAYEDAHAAFEDAG